MGAARVHVLCRIQVELICVRLYAINIEDIVSETLQLSEGKDVRMVLTSGERK